MFKVSVVEKILGQIAVNTYEFSDRGQMEVFKGMCEEDGEIVLVREVAA